MSSFSREIKDFLIVAIILVLGGWGFLKWQEIAPAKTDDQMKEERKGEQKIVCKVDKELKDFVKCSKNGDLIQFYLDRARSQKFFEIETQKLLDECENRECKNFHIGEDLKNFAVEPGINTISVFIPNLLSGEDLQKLIADVFAKNTPQVGDEIKIHFLSVPDEVFVAEYAFFDIRSDIINFRRNKNKVIRIFASPKKEKKEKDFSFKEKELFYSPSDFETKLQAFLAEKSGVSEEAVSVSNIFYEVTRVVPSEGRKQTALFFLDDSISFPKARYYELNAEDYDKFYANQRYYNRKAEQENAACEAQNEEGCEIKLLWTESFANYYIRRTRDQLIDSVELRVSYSPNNFDLMFLYALPEERSSFQVEKETIIRELEDLLKEKIIEAPEK